MRDTFEIPKSRVKIDKRSWNRTLLPVLDRLRDDLGLPSDCRLRAELHSMLVYAPGQFFVPHQDSEKADDMVGSLVVTLPGAFTGGALVVEHRGEKATYRSSKQSLSFVAFYADCRHEVRPVKSGYRVVLTYNLLLRGEADVTAAVPREAVDVLVGCLDEHFATPVPMRRSTGVEAAPPNRLVYLLDHEYTERGLSWPRLKGSDRQRAAALRAAAEGTGCEVVLALAEVHETWSCYGPEWDAPWHSRGCHRSWGDDLDDEDAWTATGDPRDPDDYDLEELIDWGITLDCWIGPTDERPEAIATSVGVAEACATTPSVELRPYASEYEGYMGNYGNTMDRWYRRGALVLWPRQQAFAVRAEASPAWALDALAARVRAGDLAGAQTQAATLAPFWRTVAGAEPRRGVFTKALRVARGLEDPPLAALLLEPFPLEMLAHGHASALTTLVGRYGEGWARDLFAVWSARGERWPPWRGGDRPAWVASLGRLCEALDAVDDSGGSTARLLVHESWRWLRDEVERRRVLKPPSYRDERLGELAEAILGVLESTAVLGASNLRDEVIGFLCADDDLLPCLIQLLQAGDEPSGAERGAAGLDGVARHCAEQLEARLARPPRANDDWSIDVPDGCGCDLCATLGRFLADPSQRTLEWPLAKDGRRHVHGRIDRAELPVSHQTRRQGRPYTLVLAKTPALFERELLARDLDEADRAWLEGAWGPFDRLPREGSTGE
ncbi:MAG: 2OG-Fe(II) oxygenase [Nitriliruptorales bacterium]